MSLLTSQDNGQSSDRCSAILDRIGACPSFRRVVTLLIETDIEHAYGEGIDLAFDLHLAFSKAHSLVAELSLVFADRRVRGESRDFTRFLSQPRIPGIIHAQSFSISATDRGTARTEMIDLVAQEPIVLFLEIKYAGIDFQNTGRAFVGPLDHDDQLSLHFVSDNTIVGNVLHRREHGEDCVARCANGQSRQGCITCQGHGVTIKICC